MALLPSIWMRYFLLDKQIGSLLNEYWEFWGTFSFSFLLRSTQKNLGFVIYVTGRYITNHLFAQDTTRRCFVKKYSGSLTQILNYIQTLKKVSGKKRLVFQPGISSKQLPELSLSLSFCLWVSFRSGFEFYLFGSPILSLGRQCHAISFFIFCQILHR